MIGEQVDALGLDALDRLDDAGRDQPMPEGRELALVAVDAELDLLDVCAGVFEGPHGLFDHARQVTVDGEDVVVGRVGDARSPATSRCNAPTRSTGWSMENGSRG